MTQQTPVITTRHDPEARRRADALVTKARALVHTPTNPTDTASKGVQQPAKAG